MEKYKPKTKALSSILCFIFVLLACSEGSAADFASFISCGQKSTVGMNPDGTVVAVGNNVYRQCEVNDWKDIVQISGAGRYTIGLQSDGIFIAEGACSWEYSMDIMTNIVQISAGEHHTVGVRSDGTVMAKGINFYGQCNVSGWNNVSQVSASEYYTLGLKSDGTLVVAGLYYSRDILHWSNIVKIAAGIHHAAGIQADGSVIATGSSSYGQCDVNDWRDIVQIAVGLYHTVGLRSDGTVVASGDNRYGQCDVNEWSHIIQISAGSYHTVGLKSDGTLVAVGDNSDGQCNISEWNLKKNSPATAGSFWEGEWNTIYNTNTGNVGIGTKEPVKLLDIAGALNTDGMRISGYGTDIGIELNNTGTGGQAWTISSTADENIVGNGNLLFDVDWGPGKIVFHQDGTVKATAFEGDGSRLTGVSLWSQGQGDFLTTFETGWGGWVNTTGDDINWRAHTGKTASNGTGPADAHNGKYYIYIESSYPNYPNKTALLEFDDGTSNSPSTVKFWYHMCGRRMGSLYLEYHDGISWKSAWSSTGNQGDSWQNAAVDLSPFPVKKVRFRGITGSSYSSDIALDDIQIRKIDTTKARFDGEVGIGTNYPQAKLHINGEVFFEGGDGDATGDGQVDGDDVLFVSEYLNGTRTLTIRQYAKADVNGDGKVNHDDMSIISMMNAGVTKEESLRKIHGVYGTEGDSRFRVREDAVFDKKLGVGDVDPDATLEVNGTFMVSDSASGDGNRLIIDGDGDVGIGVTDPQSKLAVNGIITAKEIKVTSDGWPWPDFIFADAHSLPPLETLAAYLSKHKHLPGIPSAAEIEEQGIAVSEMLARQMRKIEEVTLYLVALKKENERLLSRINAIDKRSVMAGNLASPTRPYAAVCDFNQSR